MTKDRPHLLGSKTYPVAVKIRDYLMANPESTKKQFAPKGVGNNELKGAMSVLRHHKAIEGTYGTGRTQAKYTWVFEEPLESLMASKQTAWRAGTPKKEYDFMPLLRAYFSFRPQ